MTQKMNKHNKPPEWSKKLGWLKNVERKKRREAMLTLTDDQVFGYIMAISKFPNYTKLEEMGEISSISKVNKRGYNAIDEVNNSPDHLIRLRDMALIGISWTWFKRGNEILHIKLGNVAVIQENLVVQLYIEKKQKTFKICPECRARGIDEKKNHNAKSAMFCKKCGTNILDVPLTKIGKPPELITKTKSVKFPFCVPFIRWIKVLRTLEGADDDSWVFPKYHYFSNQFLLASRHYTPLTIQRFDQILQRLDKNLTSAMFRYGGAEKYLRLGYTPYDVKEIGDWSNSVMPERYASKKGLTQIQKKFADDLELEKF